MEQFQQEIAEFLRSGGREVSCSVSGGLSVFSVAVAGLSVVAVPLNFFADGGTVEDLREVERSLATGCGRVFLYQDRWMSAGPAVRAMLRVRMGQGLRVFARNCEVRAVTPEAAAAFLQRNHVYGSARTRYRLGLFRIRSTGSAETGMDQTPGMVAVATFSDGRLREDGTVSYEWVRYAGVRGVSVVGGMGRLLDAFVATVGDGTPMDVMTYADLEWYDGRSYRRLGFRPCGDRAPVWFLCRPGCSGRQICRAESAVDEENGVKICNLGSLKYVRSYWDTGCTSRL